MYLCTSVISMDNGSVQIRNCSFDEVLPKTKANDLMCEVLSALSLFILHFRCFGVVSGFIFQLHFCTECNHVKCKLMQ